MSSEEKFRRGSEVELVSDIGHSAIKVGDRGKVMGVAYGRSDIALDVYFQTEVGKRRHSDIKEHEVRLLRY